MVVALQVGVIGCGFGRSVQIPALQRDARVRVVAVAGQHLASAEAAAREYSLPLAFEGWEDLIDSPEVAAVVIAAPPAVQHQAARHALTRGKPVMVEKPMAASLADARELAELADRTALPAMIDFNFTEIAAFRTAHAILTAGGIGRLRHVAVTWNVESRVNAAGWEHWKASRADGGGALFNFVSHSLHYLEWFAGPVARLSSRLSRMPGDQRSGDTFVALALDFANGAAGALTMGAASYQGLGHRIEFYGEDGTLILDNSTSDYMRGFTLSHARRPGPLTALDLGTDSDDNGADSRLLPTMGLNRRFVDWIIDGTSARPNFADGLRVQHLIDCALTSDNQGRRVDVDGPPP